MATKKSEVVKTQNGDSQNIRSLIQSDVYKKQFAMALPKHMSPERFIRIALTALTKNPKLQTCSQASLVSCLLDISQLGLEPDGRRAHLIPYGDKCTLIIDYKGLVELAMNTGEVSNIHADIVCESDVFVYNKGVIETHAIDFKKPRGKMYATYCIITFKDGTHKTEVMTKDEVDAIRKRSKAGTSGPWVTDYNEMAKKTVFRRASKWIKLSPEQREAIEKDDKYQFDAIDVTPPAGKPPVAIPQAKNPEKDNAYKAMLEEFQTAKGVVGEDVYYQILKKHGFKTSNEIRDMAMGRVILEEISQSVDQGA